MLKLTLGDVWEVSNILTVFFFTVALREYFSQFGAVERSQVLFVSKLL